MSYPCLSRTIHSHYAFVSKGYSFFPDKLAALVELHRVLKSGGRLILSIWSDISPFFDILARSLKRHIGSSIAEKSLAPFAFRDRVTIEGLLASSGFIEISVQTVDVDRKLEPAKASIPAEIKGNPVGAEIEAYGPDTLSLIVQEVKENLSSYSTEEGFSVPQTTFLFSAVARK